MSNSSNPWQFAVLTAAFTSLAAHGAVNNGARAIIQPDFSGGAGPVDINNQLPGPVSASASSTGGFNSSGSATVNTTYGSIRSQSHAEGSLNAQGWGTIRDTLIFSAPGFPSGTTASVTYSIRVEGSLSASQGSSASTWSVGTDIGGGAFDLGKTGRFNSPTLFPSGYQGDPFGTYTATGTVQLGFAAPLLVEFKANADAANTSNQSGLATVHDARLYWGGITSVKINGVTVPGATFTSESGTNWGIAATPCPGDLNGDSQVDDSDFVVFVVAYNILDCADPSMPAGCPADLNNDGFVDDADFVAFVSAYDQLTCP